MNKFTFTGNGRNKNFYFTFPFFSKNDIVVKINNTVATEYGVFCISGNNNNDFPFTGGHIHFASAPKSTDIVTIERKLQLNRLIDYQPTVALNPTTVNQDMNYFFESLKDIKSILNEFNEKYAEFTDTESANDLKERITAVTEQIDDFAEQIESIGDITTIQTSINSLSQSVSDLTSTIATHTTSIGTNTNNITTLKGYDYVIESQLPTAENNYTWYRKYKSGWVEQGGETNSVTISAGWSNSDTVIVFPITMTDTNYTVTFGLLSGAFGSINISKTTTGGTITIYNRSAANNDQYKTSWYVAGFSE